MSSSIPGRLLHVGDWPPAHAPKPGFIRSDAATLKTGQKKLVVSRRPGILPISSRFAPTFGDPPMPGHTPADSFADALVACRRFLLALANSGLPTGLMAKGGASDLVQKTLAAAHRHRGQFNGTTLAELRAWLRAILRNELAMFRRRYHTTGARDVRREVTIEAAALVPAGPDLPVDYLARSERDRAVAAAVAGLPDDDRLVVTLRVEYGLAFATIGARVGRSEEATRKMYVRALNKLRGLVPADA